MKLRVLVVMPGHLSTTPRLLKVADAASDAGYRVRVVSGSFLEWAAQADATTAASRRWTWQPVEFRRAVAGGTYLATGVRRHIARTIVTVTDPTRAPWWAVTRALSRTHDELVSQALSEPCDLVVGGSVGGLAVVPEIAARQRVPFGLDLEDLHTAELDTPDAGLQHGAARRVLTDVLPRAQFVTTSSAPMAEAYHAAFGVTPTVIHNVFALPALSIPPAAAAGPLRMYWFSQTIGPGRGLEDAVRAAGLAGLDAQLTLRGRSDGVYVAQLLQLAEREAPRLTIDVQPPAPPDLMLALCEGHDIGLNLELPLVPNRRVCLTNKIFTYLPKGLPVVLSDTPAHRWLAARLGEAAFVYPTGRLDAFAAQLRAWADNREQLARAGRAARAAATDRWRWDHRDERDAMLALMAKALA